ncbi:hypothetical protein [Cohaesibacter celericrescens]|uniref:Uncharacterized protein n=1 Tax=Cohaesibacter celericrescens TaxID=2067669 RepID=A0A2N5XV32_9HYPH|nr:hypothetical protein [Cohaesibacter celericrescens]PLW78371.1 hypothetical protein C0081_04560 [Cohaesibacter celericrescens]
MDNYEISPGCIKAARAIALEAEAILPCTCTEGFDAMQNSLDAQILAYSIGAERVRTGSVTFSREEMMKALEKVIDEAKSLIPMNGFMQGFFADYD